MNAADNERLARKVASGKGLNASDRELMASIILDPKQCKPYTDMVIEFGKKTEKLTVEMLDGQGKFGRYMKVTVPGSYKSLNMGEKKFVRFMGAIKEIGYDEVLAAYQATELHAPWEFDVVEK